METTERCPWCGTIIARAQFLKIEERIRTEETKKLQQVEAATRKQLEDKFQKDLETARAKVIEAESVARKRAESMLSSITAERDRTVEKVKALEARETTLRRQLTEEAAKAAKKQIDEMRSILERDRDQVVTRERAALGREREAMQKKVADLERQLQKKTAHELGDGAEIDLYEALREAFPPDRITRVQKGEAGADILHTVLHKGEPCGLIVIDSKNRKGWQNVFASKLHQDKIAAKAHHAILATNVFPSGKKEFCIHGNVLVMSPARVVDIVWLLRDQLIQMHVKGLSMHERTDKMGRLYTYITSDACAQHFKEADKVADEILDLDVQEVKEHHKTWQARGMKARHLKTLLREMSTEITAIVEGPAKEEARTA